MSDTAASVYLQMAWLVGLLYDGTADMHVPTAWLVGALWVVTLGLVGFVGRALYAKLSAMEAALEHIANTAHELAEAHARVEERHSALVARVDRLERTCERQHH